ncbi:MAG: hypothetical protein GXP29_00335, partial [Planctomycetes bacterium]|nr:hypothetical protein [Planctomycetota bacterium]
MTSHLSTSSFDVAAGAPAGTRRSGEASRVAAVLRRSLAYPPYAALITVGVIAVFHLIAAHLVVNQPLPDDRLLAKVRALTGDVSPVLIVAGDSRGRTGINPIQIAAALGVPQKSAVNIALPGCDTSSMRAAYRSFVRQETANPIMLMNLTIFSVNDAARKRAEMHDELLWSIDWKDRFRVAPMGRAIVATFQPEKAIYRKMRDAIFPSVPPITEQGFKGRGSGDWSEAFIASNVRLMSHDWYAGFQSSGIRWQQTERDLLALQTKGVQ